MSFKDFYDNQVRPQLAQEMKLANILSAPKIVKIVVNVGAGDATTNKKVLESIVSELALITGQKPVITLARKSISAFKIRKGLPIGVKVTLRGKKMYAFLEKLIKIVLPRIRDFRGIRKQSFDGRGNLNVGISEQTLFGEIEYDTIHKIRGLEITIVTNTQNNEKAEKLFKVLGMPFAV